MALNTASPSVQSELAGLVLAHQTGEIPVGRAAEKRCRLGRDDGERERGLVAARALTEPPPTASAIRSQSVASYTPLLYPGRGDPSL